ncbi:MAG: signal recognition particle protein [Firmicutes bacterium]|nr:signal recognition particle protein [Bacillota bacterium]
MFTGLGEKLNHIFSKLKNKGKLTALEIKEAMREVRIALLEADVNLMVVKQFVAEVTEEAMGEEVLGSLSPGQQVIKIVNEKLTALMGNKNEKLNFSSQPPTVIMLCGLQGAGKTTHAGKLAYKLKSQGKKVMLVACDIYRPAAIDQLKVVATKAGAEFFEMGKTNPVKIAQEAIKKAQKELISVVILDTAGRLHIDETLMSELKEIKKIAKPTEILLTVDSMTGQDAVTVAKTFDEQLEITGVILTKLDGDTRGGAALSIKHVTGKPIKFTGVGEKIADLEPFHPDRMASRILGMGDVLTLIDTIMEGDKTKEIEEMEENIRKNTFTFEDYLKQMDQVNKMGGISKVMKMIPGMDAKAMGQIDEKDMLKTKAIIQSMTPQERRNPDLMKSSRKQRIAKGSGTTVNDINRLIKQFEQTKVYMKQVKAMGKKGGFRGGLPF